MARPGITKFDAAVEMALKSLVASVIGGYLGGELLTWVAIQLALAFLGPLDYWYGMFFTYPSGWLLGSVSAAAIVMKTSSPPAHKVAGNLCLVAWVLAVGVNSGLWAYGVMGDGSVYCFLPTLLWATALFIWGYLAAP